MLEPLIDANQAAAILKVHPVTLREMADLGKIPALKIGRCWRFRESSLDEWIRDRLGSNRKESES